MGKIKSLVNLIKVSTKAQIITGTIAVGVVATGAVGGYVIYNNAQQAKLEALSLEEKEKAQLEEMQKYHDEMSIKVNNLIHHADAEDLKSHIENISFSLIPNKDYTTFTNNLQSYEDLYNKTLKYSEDKIKEYTETIKKIDYSLYVDGTKDKVSALNKEFETLAKEGKYSDANSKYNEIDKLISESLKPVEEKKEENKEEPVVEEDTTQDYVADSSTGSSVNNSTNNSSNNVTATTPSAPATKPSTQATKPSTPAPAPQPEPEPAPVPVGLYQMSPSFYQQYLNWGIDLQSIPVGGSFNINSDGEIIYYMISDNSELSSYVTETFKGNFPEGATLVTGRDYLGTLNSNGATIYLYQVYSAE